MGGIEKCWFECWHIYLRRMFLVLVDVTTGVTTGFIVGISTIYYIVNEVDTDIDHCATAPFVTTTR